MEGGPRNMKRVAESLLQPAAAVTNKRVKEWAAVVYCRSDSNREHHDLHIREPEEETNSHHCEEGVSDDHERSIATDPGQPLSANLPLHILETIFDSPLCPGHHELLMLSALGGAVYL